MAELRCAIDVAPFGELGEPSVIASLAEAAEAAGWDGLSIWDVLGTSMGTTAPDPFIALAAAAARTTHLRLITSVIALPRRRPHLVAQAASTLDRWSGGRLTLGVGAGADPAEHAAFGDTGDQAARIARFDEAVELVDRFLRGEPVEHAGPSYVARGGAVCPPPVQLPRPPIWVGGMRPGGVRRAARRDGWIAIAMADDGSGMTLAPEAFGAMVASAHAARATAGLDGEPFDIAVLGTSDPADTMVAAGFAAHGATWWLESLSPMRGDLKHLMARIEAGPPR